MKRKLVITLAIITLFLMVGCQPIPSQLEKELEPSDANALEGPETHEVQVIEVTDSSGLPLQTPELFVGGDPTKITYEQIMKIEQGMTYSQVVEVLGPTADIGSGLHVLHYRIEDGKELIFSVFRWDTPIEKELIDLIEEIKEGK